MMFDGLIEAAHDLAAADLERHARENTSQTCRHARESLRKLREGLDASERLSLRQPKGGPDA